MGNRIHFLDLLYVLAKHKKKIVYMVFGITLLSLVVSLVIPKTYKSTLTFLPPVSQGSVGGLASLGVSGLLQSQMTTERLRPENLMIMVKSRDLRIQLINEFDLAESFEEDNIDILLRKIDNIIEISDVREGGFGYNPLVSMSISIKDRDPQKAHDMVVFFVDLIDQRVRELNRINAEEGFNVISERLGKNLQDVESAAIKLNEFQQRTGIFALEVQTERTFEAIADLQASIVSIDVSIGLLERLVDPNNLELRNLRLRKSEIEKQLDMLIKEQDASVRTILPSIETLQKSGLEHIALHREFTVQNRIYETLIPIYEQQQMNYSNALRSIQVMDQAFVPEYKDGPKRAFIVIGGFLFSVFITLFWIYTVELFRVGSETGNLNSEKLKLIVEELKSN